MFASGDWRAIEVLGWSGPERWQASANVGETLPASASGVTGSPPTNTTIAQAQRGGVPGRHHNQYHKSQPIRRLLMLSQCCHVTSVRISSARLSCVIYWPPVTLTSATAAAASSSSHYHPVLIIYNLHHQKGIIMCLQGIQSALSNTSACHTYLLHMIHISFISCPSSSTHTHNLITLWHWP